MKITLTLTTAILAAAITTGAGADDDLTLDAAIGGAVGGAVGGAIGAEVGGRDGAIVGAGIGAATGAAINTRDDADDGRDHGHDDGGHIDYDHGHAAHPPAHPHRGHFCPPGQAKKGRC